MVKGWQKERGELVRMHHDGSAGADVQEQDRPQLTPQLLPSTACYRSQILLNMLSSTGGGAVNPGVWQCNGDEVDSIGRAFG